MYREKRAIEDIDDTEEMIRYLQKEFNADTRLLEQEQLKQDDLEQVAIIRNPTVLSVFPILKTKKQHDNETWIKFDTRPKSLAQKEASLFVIQENGKKQIEVWSKGRMQASSDDQELNAFVNFMWHYFARENITIRQIEDATVFLKNTENVSRLEQCLQFPLFLPTNWETLWEFQSISQHMLLCSNCNACD